MSRLPIRLHAVMRAVMRALSLPLSTLTPRLAELSETVLVFSGIRRWIWERRTRPSAKSRPSRWIQGIHCLPFLLWAVDAFNTQSMAGRNRKGDSKHSCHSCVYLKGVCQLATTDHSACHSTAGIFNDAGDHLLCAIVSQQFPGCQMPSHNQ